MSCWSKSPAPTFEQFKPALLGEKETLLVAPNPCDPMAVETQTVTGNKGMYLRVRRRRAGAVLLGGTGADGALFQRRWGAQAQGRM